jgi:hypothetical protein
VAFIANSTGDANDEFPSISAMKALRQANRVPVAHGMDLIEGLDGPVFGARWHDPAARAPTIWSMMLRRPRSFRRSRSA